MGGLSADPPRLIKDPNINTDKPVSGNSQHAARSSAGLKKKKSRKHRGSSDSYPHREKPEVADETKAAAGKRRRLTEDGGVASGGQQAPERHVHQHLEAGPVEGGRVRQRL